MNRSFLIVLFSMLMGISVSCKKSTGSNGSSADTTGQTPHDPAVAPTIGFFLNDWIPRAFTTPAYIDTAKPTGTTSAYVIMDPSSVITKIPNTVFGQNSNIWMTQIVTEPSLMNDLVNLHPGIIRFPAGSLSDMYFWNADKDVPPADAPDSLPDANGTMNAAGYWYGKNAESWTQSVDNYYKMLQQTGRQSIITVNYGYARYGTGPHPVQAAAHLAADWVRYDNGRTKYWEIGNEDNGTWESGYRINTTANQDGQPQIITGDLYGQHVKIFADSMRKAAQEIGKTIYIGAQLLEKQPESWQTNTDKTWNQGVLTQVNSAADFYIIHSYYTPYQQNSSASVILNTATDNTTGMMNYLKSSITTAGAMQKPIALTEWNITSQGSKQQVSFINGMHAAILLGEAIKNQYGETSRWDLANGWNNGNDMGLFNIGDEPGVVRWNPRPAFYYMYYLRQTMGDRLIDTRIIGPSDVLAYGSSFTSGQKALMLVNKGTTGQQVNITLQNATPGSRYYWYTLTGGTDNGEFSGSVFVNGHGPAQPTGGPSDYATLKAYSAATQNAINVFLPARSVIYLVIDK